MKRANGKMAAKAVRWLGLSMVCVCIASCSATDGGTAKKTRSKEYFPESKYGKASPRVVENGPIPRGGGRYMVGKPYQVAGQTYVPKDNPAYDKQGVASWYGSAFHGRATANGEVYDTQYLSAAHRTLPLPSYARVTNVENGSSVMVRINDRGPFHSDRIIDVSRKTAELLDLAHSGTARVRVQYVGPAPLEGNDEPYLMASYTRKGDRFPAVTPTTLAGPGVMVASNEPVRRDPRPGSQSSAAPEVRPQPRQAPAVIAAAAPVPQSAQAMQTSYAGPTPTDGGHYLQVPQAQPFSDFVLLPEFGPHPIERPGGMGMRGSFASAYIENMSSDGKAFDAILVRQDDLNQDAIRAYASRGARRS